MENRGGNYLRNSIQSYQYLRDIKISPHVREFVKYNKTFSDLKIEKTVRDEIWIRKITDARLSKLKNEIRNVTCQAYLLEDEQYEWWCEEGEKFLSHTEKQFQVKGKTFTSMHRFVTEVNDLIHISVVNNEFPIDAVDSLIILSNQEPSPDYDLVFVGHGYKVFQKVPWVLPANQVVYAEITPSFMERQVSTMLETCLTKVYESYDPVTVLGIQLYTQSFPNLKTVLSCLASSIERLQAEQVNISKHYIMLMANKEKIKSVFGHENIHAQKVKGDLKVTVIDGDLSEQKVTVIDGDLSEQKVDVIVNSIDHSLNLENGNISKALLAKAGKDLQVECNRKKKEAHNSICLITRGYKLPCEYVLHGILSTPFQSSITNLVYACLEKVSNFQLKSIAFPTLGIGNLKCPVDTAVKEMQEGISNFLTKYPTHNIEEIKIVVFPGQPEIRRKFLQLITNVPNPSNPSSTSEEKCLKDFQQKLLHWILFVNYSNIKENMEYSTRCLQKNLKKVPFNLDSEDLENLIFFGNLTSFGDISSLVPDFFSQYSEKKDGEIQLLVPKENSKKIKDMLSDIKKKIISENFKLEVKLEDKQVERALQEIQLESPRVRCQFSDHGQSFIFHSFDKNLNKQAKDQLMFFLDSKDDISFTENQFSQKEENLSSSYFKQENIRDETMTAPRSQDSDNSSWWAPEGIGRNKQDFKEADTFVSWTLESEKTEDFVSSHGKLKHIKTFSTADTDEISHRYSQFDAEGPSRNERFARSTQNIQNIYCFPMGDSLLVKVYEADILNLKVDGIVNAANRWLAHGGGVAWAIINSAGDGVIKEGREKINDRGLNDGEVLSTSAGNLTHYKNIIHAVEPMNTSSNKNCQKKLEETIYNSLAEANQLGLRSVALPAISSGIFRVPLDICTEAYVMGVKEFYKTMPSNCQLKEVHFVDRNSNTCKAIKDKFAKYLNEVTDVPVNNIHQSNDNSANIASDKHDAIADINAKTCVLCKCKTPEAQQLKCDHRLCSDCKKTLSQPMCPWCKIPFDMFYGDQPNGSMVVSEISDPLPGFSDTITYEIVYSMEDNKWKAPRKAFLPKNENGDTILKMLQLAFRQRLIFTFLKSSSQRKFLTWGEINHKTSKYGGISKYSAGYPDPDYFNRVTMELAAKGITPDLVAKKKIGSEIVLS